MTTRRCTAGIWLALVSSGPLAAAYRNLIATSDGASVFFEVQTSFSGTRWYQARVSKTGLELSDAGLALADASADGSTIATASFGERSCGFAGSTCFTAPPCAATFSVAGPAGRVEVFGRKTFARLNRTGTLVWIEQTRECRGLGPPLPPERQGLYEAPSLRQVAPSGGLVLASRRAGRRLITERDQALAQAANTQLHLVGRDGAREIRHQYRADEAVIDAAGRNIVYTDGSPGPVHWLDLVLGAEDEIGIGSAPALSDDGSVLAYLSADGSLMVYRRETRQAARAAGNVTEFTLAGNGQFLFAVDADNRLLRIEAATGTAATWLEPFPEFRDASAGLADRDPASCPLVCYSGFEPLLQLGRGSLFIFSGRYWTAGWRVRVGDVERPLQLLSGESAWFQVPDEAADGRQPLVVFHPQHPLRISATAQVTERYISCLGALHQGFDRPVSAQDAAYIGEIVHVFLTGLAGVEAVAEGVPNPAGRLIPVVAPPALGGSGAVRSLFFGLAPGLIGMQQLDLWMLGPVTAGQRLFEDAPSAPNCEIPPATP